MLKHLYSASTERSLWIASIMMDNAWRHTTLFRQFLFLFCRAHGVEWIRVSVSLGCFKYILCCCFDFRALAQSSAGIGPRHICLSAEFQTTNPLVCSVPWFFHYLVSNYRFTSLCFCCYNEWIFILWWIN